MPLWARVSYQGRECFGTIVDDTIALHAGDMFANPRPTGESHPARCGKAADADSPEQDGGAG